MTTRNAKLICLPDDAGWAALPMSSGDGLNAMGNVACDNDDEATRSGLNVSESTIDKLIDDMNRSGFAVIRGYVLPAELARMRDFVSNAIAAAGQSYVGFVGKEAVAGSDSPRCPRRTRSTT